MKPIFRASELQQAVVTAMENATLAKQKAQSHNMAIA
jgi:hypothetical protein